MKKLIDVLLDVADNKERKEKEIWIFAEHIVICFGKAQVLMDVLGISFKELDVYKIEETDSDIDIDVAVTFKLKRGLK